MNPMEALKTHPDKQLLHFLWLFFITTILAGFINLIAVLGIALIIIGVKEIRDGRIRNQTDHPEMDTDTLLDIVAGILGAIAGAAYSLV